MVAAISVFVFWTAFFGILSAKHLCFKDDDPVEDRIHRLLGHEHEERKVGGEELLITTNTSPSKQRMMKRLVLAGMNRKRDLERAIHVSRICHLTPVLISITLFLMGFPIGQILAVSALFGIILIVIPRLWLLRTILKRRRQIERSLPDALDLLILCLEAGLSFDACLVRVAREMRSVSPPISSEFTLTNQEILAGKSREAALKNLAWRTGIDDVSSVVGAIQQSIKLGTSLVRALIIQADVIRKKRREKIRGKILQTPVKLIFPLLFFIFPTLMMIILGPSLVNIFRQLNQVGY